MTSTPISREEQAARAAQRIASRTTLARDGSCPDCGGPVTGGRVGELGGLVVRYCPRCAWSDWLDVERYYLSGLDDICLP